MDGSHSSSGTIEEGRQASGVGFSPSRRQAAGATVDRRLGTGSPAVALARGGAVLGFFPPSPRHEGRLTTKEDGAGQVRTAGGGGGVQLAGAVGQGHPSKMWPAVPGQGAPSFGRPQGDRVASLVAARVTFRGLAMAGGRRRTGSPKNVGRRTGGRVTPRLVSPLRARRLPGGQPRRFGRSREPGEPCACLLLRWFTYGRPPADRTAVAAAAARSV